MRYMRCMRTVDFHMSEGDRDREADGDRVAEGSKLHEVDGVRLREMESDGDGEAVLDSE